MQKIRDRLSAPNVKDQRSAFGAFQTPDPIVGDLSERMLAETPEDPKAMTTRGWYLYAAGWAFRGSSYGHSTYPEGAAKMRALHEEAAALVDAALKADPTLLPASDLTMLLSMTLGTNNRVPDEFARIMAINPTCQSLYVAAAAYAPQWGGLTEFGYEACDVWASKLPDMQDFTPLLCRIDLTFTASYNVDEETLNSWLALPMDHPIMDNVQLTAARRLELTEAEAIAIFNGLNGDKRLGLRDYETWDRLESADPMKAGPRTIAALPGVIANLRFTADFDPGDSLSC